MAAVPTLRRLVIRVHLYDEYFGSIYTASDWDIADGSRTAAIRNPRVQFPASGFPAEDGLSCDQRWGIPRGRRSADHGFCVSHAAGAAVRADCGGESDDFFESTGLHRNRA